MYQAPRCPSPGLVRLDLRVLPNVNGRSGGVLFATRLKLSSRRSPVCIYFCCTRTGTFFQPMEDD